MTTPWRIPIVAGSLIRLATANAPGIPGTDAQVFEVPDVRRLGIPCVHSVQRPSPSDEKIVVRGGRKAETISRDRHGMARKIRWLRRFAPGTKWNTAPVVPAIRDGDQAAYPVA